MFYMPFDSPHQDESNGTSFILSSSFYKLKNNFYYFLKIENILTDSLLVKYLFLINEVPIRLDEGLYTEKLLHLF